MKTLALILHFNTPEMTDSLYESVKETNTDNYDLFVLDNGSDLEKRSKYHNLSTGKNIYFGGAVNWAFDYILKNEQYDSLLFMNSDLNVPTDLIKTLRTEMFNNDFRILSPSVFETSQEGGVNVGCRQINNWNTKKTRNVRWIDNQCPLFRRDFIVHVNQFDKRLIYGFGQELLCGIICEEQNWKIGVCDQIEVQHLGNATMNSQNIKGHYCWHAGKNSMRYFRATGQRWKRKQMVEYGYGYKI